MKKRQVARRKRAEPRKAPKFVNFERTLIKHIDRYKDYIKQIKATEEAISHIDVSTAYHYANYEAPEFKRKLKEKIEKYAKSIEDLYECHGCKEPLDDVAYKTFFNHFDVNKEI